MYGSKNKLILDEVQLGNGVIINQYPQKLWLTEDLVVLPIWSIWYLKIACYYLNSAIVFKIRLSEIGYFVPICWANKLTLSSSII